MTKKSKKNTGPRFDYMGKETQPATTPVTAPTAPLATPTPVAVEVALAATQRPEKAPPTPAPTQPVLATVPRGQGRMEQAREQLNVRLPTDLKRRAIAGAALEGLTAGELIERLLLEYLAK